MNLSAFSAAPCSLKFSDMATPLVDGCRDASIVSPNGVATHIGAAWPHLSGVALTGLSNLIDKFTGRAG